MIYTYLIDFENLKNSESLREKYLSTDVLNYVYSTKNEGLLRARTALYSALALLLREYAPSVKYELQREENGKPYLTLNGRPADLHISLSHTESMAVITLSKSGKIGVDIEEKRQIERARQLENRYFGTDEDNKIDLKNQEKADADFSLISINENGELCFGEKGKCQIETAYEIDREDASQAFLSKWVITEALTKCDGVGVAARKEIRKMLENKRVNLYALRINKKEYYVSIAEEK